MSKHKPFMKLPSEVSGIESQTIGYGKVRFNVPLVMATAHGREVLFVPKTRRLAIYKGPGDGGKGTIAATIEYDESGNATHASIRRGVKFGPELSHLESLPELPEISFKRLRKDLSKEELLGVLNRDLGLTQSARMLGIEFETLKRHMKRHGLDPDDYRKDGKVGKNKRRRRYF